MSAIFSDPLFFGGLFNPDIKANKNTFLNLGQGSPAPPPPPPGLPPSISPVLQKIPGSNPDTTLFISFNVSLVEGTAPITYTLAWGTGGTLPNQAVLTVNGNDYTTLVTGLTPNTTSSFQLTMTNAYGVDIGIVYDFQTDPTPPPPPPSDPSGPPTTPMLIQYKLTFFKTLYMKQQQSIYYQIQHTYSDPKLYLLLECIYQPHQNHLQLLNNKYISS